MVWKLARSMAVNLFYFGILSILIVAVLALAFRGNLLGALSLILFFSVITGGCHEMHECVHGMICQIGKLFWRLNFLCRRK